MLKEKNIYGNKHLWNILKHELEGIRITTEMFCKDKYPPDLWSNWRPPINETKFYLLTSSVLLQTILWSRIR